MIFMDGGLFGEISRITDAYLAAQGIKPGAANAAFRKSSAAVHESMRTKPVRAIQRPDELYEETKPADIACQWIKRCQISPEEALLVLSEIDSQDELFAKLIHMIFNVGMYTDCSKVMGVLVESCEGALLAAANHD